MLIDGNQSFIIHQVINHQHISTCFQRAGIINQNVKNKESGGVRLYAAVKIDEGVFVPFIKRTLERHAQDTG